MRGGGHALRIVSTDKILRFINTFIIIIRRRRPTSADHANRRTHTDQLGPDPSCHSVMLGHETLH